jgi:predicted ATP-dependent serine protease
MIKSTDDISDHIPTSFFGGSNLSVGKQRPHVKSRNHECKSLGPFQQGEIEIMNKKPTFNFEVNSATEKIIGRNEDIQRVVDLIMQKTPLVLIHGLVGIGKSALISKVTQFFQTRETFKDGIIYISMRDRQFVNILVFRLDAYIFQHKSESDEPMLLKFSS